MKKIYFMIFLFLLPITLSQNCTNLINPSEYNMTCGIPEGCNYNFGLVWDIAFYQDKVFMTGRSSTQITILDIDYNQTSDEYKFTIIKQLNETKLGINASCSAYGKCAGSIAYDPEENRIFYNYWSDVEKGLLIYDLDTDSVTYKNSTYGSCWISFGASKLDYSTKHNMLAWAQACVGLILFNPTTKEYQLIQAFNTPAYPPSPLPNVKWCGDYIIFHGGDGYQKHSSWSYGYLTHNLITTSLQSYDPFMWVDCGEGYVYQTEILGVYHSVNYITDKSGTPISFYRNITRNGYNSASYNEEKKVFVTFTNFDMELVNRTSNESLLYCKNATIFKSGALTLSRYWYLPQYRLVFGSSDTTPKSLFVWRLNLQKEEEVEQMGYYCGNLGICWSNFPCFLESLVDFSTKMIYCLQPLFWLLILGMLASVLYLGMKGFSRKF